MNRLTMKFCEYYNTFDDFKTKYNAMPTFLKVLNDAQLEKVYYLLMGEYGNSSFANMSVEISNQRIFNTIYEFAPIYFKKREIQEAILALNMNSDDVLAGTTAIYNSAANDGSLPSTQTTNELGYIDNQNVTKYKRTKLEGYANYYDLLSNDPSKDFIAKFRPIFSKFIEFPDLIDFTY